MANPYLDPRLMGGFSMPRYGFPGQQYGSPGFFGPQMQGPQFPRFQKPQGGGGGGGAAPRPRTNPIASMGMNALAKEGMGKANAAMGDPIGTGLDKMFGMGPNPMGELANNAHLSNMRGSGMFGDSAFPMNTMNRPIEAVQANPTAFDLGVAPTHGGMANTMPSAANQGFGSSMPPTAPGAMPPAPGPMMAGPPTPPAISPPSVPVPSLVPGGGGMPTMGMPGQAAVSGAPELMGGSGADALLTGAGTGAAEGMAGTAATTAATDLAAAGLGGTAAAGTAGAGTAAAATGLSAAMPFLAPLSLGTMFALGMFG